MTWNQFENRIQPNVLFTKWTFRLNVLACPLFGIKFSTTCQYKTFFDLYLDPVLIFQRIAVALEVEALFSPFKALLNKSPHPY